MIAINDIINEKNIEKSMEYLKSKPNSCGCDGMYLSELESYWKKNKSQIIGLIKSGKYKFGTIKQFDALQKNGKIRRISIYIMLLTGFCCVQQLNCLIWTLMRYCVIVRLHSEKAKEFTKL